MVLSACERRGVGYYCASCHTFLANVGQILIHADAGGPHALHLIVRYCSECRKYEACDQAQLDALDPLPSLREHQRT